MVTARELLVTYEIRKEGYERGLIKYGRSLYDAVCVLVRRLAEHPVDELVRIEDRDGHAVFVVARTGVEIARLPARLVKK
jgi:hypothetical protein